MKAGDKVTWRREARGGYGYVERIPGEVIRVTGHRVTLKVTLKDGTKAVRSAKPENVEVAQ